MQRLVGLFLSRPLFEARAFSSQPQLNDFLELVIVSSLAADFNDPLHIAALGSDQSSGNLKLFVVVNLDVKPASVFDIFVRSCGRLLKLGLVAVLIEGVLVDVLGRELSHWLALGAPRGSWRLGLVVEALPGILVIRLLFALLISNNLLLCFFL